MEEKLLNGLNDIGYKGVLLEKNKLLESLEKGPKDTEYTILINFLTNEIRTLFNIDEEVNIINGPEDSVSFIMEVSSFLKELNCPYSSLTQGHVSDRLQTVFDKILLVDYLLSELMSARILQNKKPDKSIELKLHETEEAANIKQILITLRFPKPPPNITVASLFQKLIPSVQSAVQKAGDELIQHPALNGSVSNKQWELIKNVQKDLNEEYKIRREMMLTRLDVTIQSFQWSDKTKGKDDLFEKIYTEKRTSLKIDPNIDISDLIAARNDIAIIEKTSNSSVRKNTRSSLNKVIIGQVPDRGGRTSEQAPPPPEMPSWQQRAPGPSRGGDNFSRGGNQQGRGNYNSNRGNFSNEPNYNKNRNYDNNYQQQRGSYDTDRSGNYSDNSNRRGGYSNYDSTPQNFDSAGYYGGQDRHYEQNSKRVKTYDSFQSNKTTYADQYVQETQHNQKYQGGGNSRSRGGRGRGRSNYNRGGGGGGRNYY